MATKYKKSFKDSAVKLAERVGAKKAAEQLTEEAELDPPLTAKAIRGWARDRGVDISTPEDRAKVKHLLQEQSMSNAQRREGLKGKVLDRCEQILDAMGARHEMWMKGEGGALELVDLRRPPANAMKDYALAYGILIDKLRLEEGESTSRQEHVSKSDRDQIDDELDRMASELARRAMEEGAHGQPAPVPTE